MKKQTNQIGGVRKKVLGNGGMALFLLVFLLSQVVLIKINTMVSISIDFFGVALKISDISGVISQVQVMAVVALVVLYEKKGHIIGIGLCVFAIILNMIPIIATGKIASLVGITILCGAMIISIIIYQYARRLIGHAREIDRQKEALNRLANYDALTDLPNRRSIINELKVLTQGECKKLRSFSVVFIDIDDFKKINDSAGHHQGDVLLQQVVERWKEVVHPEDLLGRIGGDEFALIIRRELSSTETFDYIEKLRVVLGERIVIEHRRFSITASFGIAKYEKDADDAMQLLKYADTAMYAAKSTGKDAVRFFSPMMHEALIKKMDIENNLLEAVENNELYLMYQPQYTCGNKCLRGFEVLLRWQSEELGMVTPDKFIPVAEETGQIIPIGRWVLETACERFKSIMATYNQEVILSVNISVVQLVDPNFIQMVKEVLVKTEFNPHYLEFEITESVFISSKEYVISVLTQLRALGIHIALDDFGTSYASLSYIQMLPLDVLKIDKSFIDPIDVDDNVIVGPIISIAQKLNYKVVAEGIEKEEQLRYLKDKGCDYMQGYLWGKPLIEEDMKALVASQVSQAR